MNTPKHSVASAHGRFQPLHNEHLDYLLRALQRCDFLHVGITQYVRSDLQSVAGAAEHRDRLGSNPLTYFERGQLIDLALQSAAVPPQRYRISPFPIEKPDDLSQFLDPGIRVFSTRVDDWNDAKLEILRRAGFEAEYLFERKPRGVSGSEIRDLMAANDDAWQAMVPNATIPYLLQINLPGRIRELTG